MFKLGLVVIYFILIMLLFRDIAINGCGNNANGRFMSITREELEVGREYIYGYITRKITAIGEELLLTKVKYHLPTNEEEYSIKDFIQFYSLPPKPKENITIVEYYNGHGHVLSVSLEKYKEISSVNYKIIRQYESGGYVTKRELEIIYNEIVRIKDIVKPLREIEEDMELLKLLYPDEPTTQNNEEKYE